MDNCKILKLDLHSKIIYFVLHLFGPIALCGILGWISSSTFKTFPVSWIVVALGFVLGLYFSIDGIIKYGRFAVLSENTLMVCKGNKTYPTVIQKYTLGEGVNFSVSNYGVNINQNGESNTILYLKASPVCTFILSGILMNPVHRRGKLICENILEEINNYKNSENTDGISNKTNNLGIGFSCWFVNGIFVVISMIVIIIALIYGSISFMKSSTSHISNRFSKVYDEEIKKDPNNPELYYSRSIYKDDKSAVADLGKAIELNPKYVEAYAQRGIVKSRLKDYDGAIADCNKAVELDSKNYDAYICLGDVNTDKEDYKAAEDALNKAIEINPDDEQAYFYKWLLYMDYKPEESDAMHKKYKELQEKNEKKELGE